jgi:hypothetical protein
MTQALAQFLSKPLLPDLKARAAEPAVNQVLERQWQAEKAANRTGDGRDAGHNEWACRMAERCRLPLYGSIWEQAAHRRSQRSHRSALLPRSSPADAELTTRLRSESSNQH